MQLILYTVPDFGRSTSFRLLDGENVISSMGLADQHAHAYSFVCVFRVYGGGKIKLFPVMSMKRNIKWNIKVVGHEPNFHEQLFLEAWLSNMDPQSGNNHIAIPEVYECARA